MSTWTETPPLRGALPSKLTVGGPVLTSALKTLRDVHLQLMFADSEPAASLACS